MKRRGMVLIVVVVVVAMLTLAGLSFVAMLYAEHKAAKIQGHQLQLEHVVGSGVEQIKVFLEQSHADQLAAGGAQDNRELFSGVLVLDEPEQGRQGRFSVVSPGAALEAGSIRFGVENESARLNLGVLLQWEDRVPGSAQRALLSLPGMTESIADSILDWIDGDSTARQSGAEDDYYRGIGVPYSPRNGVPQCLEELLLVQGVTRGLLFGSDANFNHRVEAEERRVVEATNANANAEGDSGASPWASLLTVSSAERNETFDGLPRIDLNQSDLAALHAELVEAMDPAWADFIVLYRQYGPSIADLVPDAAPAASSGERPPLDFDVPASTRIESILDLIDASVELPPSEPPADAVAGIPSSDPLDEMLPAEPPAPPVVASPFTSDPVAMRSYLPVLWDRTTTDPAEVLYGRVNVNLAPVEVLRALPGIEAAVAEQIASARRSAASERRDPTWLLSEGLVELAQMKTLLPFVTCGGDVARAQVVGFLDETGPSMRVETIIDATARPPRQVYWKDLRLLGRGYPLEALGATPSGERPIVPGRGL